MKLRLIALLFSFSVICAAPKARAGDHQFRPLMLASFCVSSAVGSAGIALLVAGVSLRDNGDDNGGDDNGKALMFGGAATITAASAVVFGTLYGIGKKEA